MSQKPCTRRKVIAAIAAFGAAACASRAMTPDAFRSDRIDVDVTGAGPDLVLIHALAAHREIWRDVSRDLRASHRLHLVQIKGFGGVAPERSGPVAAPAADEIARYIAQSGLGACAIVGHSMGATIAMMIAARRPQVCTRLLVVDMLPFVGAMAGDNATAGEVRALAQRMRDEILATPPGEDSLIERMIAAQLGPSRGDEILAYARASDRRTVADAFYELIVTDLRAELSNIQAPFRVLYTIPAHAALSPEQYEAQLRSAYARSRAELIKIEGSGHYLMLDAPERLLSEIRAFLGH